VAYESHFELLEAVSPTVEKLMTEHRERRQDWYFHEFVPWEEGRSYVDEPWDESQATLSPEARTSLVLNLLTEDNLPYYHSIIDRHFHDDAVLGEWNRLWTAEEGQHAIAIRSYLLTSRNCDPDELEDDRMATMSRGYDAQFSDPAALFTYTAMQELATRVSHRNAGKIADDPVAYELMSRIAVDENHHFMFYRGVVSAMLAIEPTLVLKGMYQQLSEFQMPGTVIPGYLRRAVEMARAAVYNLRIHHDRVLQPLLRDWKIESLTGLSTKAEEIQEKLLELPDKVMRRAEAFERRFGASSSA
jgi:acyl-[acyl-carrier-protein] desaturase